MLRTLSTFSLFALSFSLGCSSDASVVASGDAARLDGATDATADASPLLDAARDAAPDTALDGALDSAADAALDGGADAALDRTIPPADAAPEASADASDGPRLVMGCPSYEDPIGAMGDPPGTETYAGFVRPLFERFCVRCHSTTLTTAVQRSGAPDGYNWDSETSVREHLMQIRRAVGVDNYMPLTDPKPSCEERRRIVRWVDIGAP